MTTLAVFDVHNPCVPLENGLSTFTGLVKDETVILCDKCYKHYSDK